MVHVVVEPGGSGAESLHPAMAVTIRRGNHGSRTR